MLPTPAAAGLKLLPLIPLPLKLPPVGLPVKVIELPLTQTEVGKPLKPTLGNAFTTTAKPADVIEQPLLFVTITA